MKKMRFLDYYRSKSASERIEIRNRFLKESGVTYPSWYVKICRGRFRVLELKLLSDICKNKFESA